jgi:hypothetical protein
MLPYIRGRFSHFETAIQIPFEIASLGVMAVPS